MAGEPLDRLEIEISSSSTDAVDKVNSLAKALERLKEASSLKGIENTAEKIKTIGDSGKKLSVEVDRSSESAVESLIEKVKILKGAIDQVNGTRIKVQGATGPNKSGQSTSRIENDIRKAEMQSIKSAGELDKAKKQLSDLSGTGLDTAEISDATTEFGKYRDAIADADSKLESLKTDLAGVGGDVTSASAEVLSRIRDAIKGVQDAQFQSKKAGELVKNALQRAKFSVADKVKESGQEVDVAKLDASIEKAKASIEDLTERYEVLQRVQGKGSQDTQTRNAAELAKVSALLEEQQRLYDSLIEKKKKYADAGIGRDENLSGTGEVQTRAVEEVTQRVGLLQRALALVRNAWSLTDSEALRATSEGTAALEGMKKSLFDNATAWSKIRSSASSAFDGVKEKIAAAAAQSQKFATALKIGIPVIGTIVSVLRGLVGIFGKLVSGALQLARTLAGAALNGVKKLASGLKSIGGHVLNYVTKPFQRAIGFIENFKKKLVSVAFYRLVRTALKMITDGFKEGIENLYQFSSLVGTQFAPAMDRLATSSLYLKNSLGAMVGPLIQSLAPVVDFLVDKFVQLLNAINMVFAALGGGGTYTKAIKNAAKYGDDLNSSMGGAAAAAKEFKRYLIGIDELNVIPEQSTPGGGGGGGGGLDTDYGSMFEQAPLPDWVKSIKDAINAGDWKGAGELLADKVNTLIDKFQKNAPTWGKKIGQAIQHGIELSLGFIRRLKIEELGASISTLIGNALNEINPGDLGAILASGIKSVFRFAHGFLQGYTGPEIGTYLSEVVNGWFAELRSDGGWKKVGEDLSNTIKSIIDGVSNFINGLDTASIAQDLKDFFGKIDWDGIWSSLENLAETAADKIDWTGILNSLYRFAANALVFLRKNILNIPDEQASQPWKDLQAKLSDANEKINWADIISGLIAFVRDIISTIKDSFPDGGWEEIWKSVKQSLSNALGFESWDDLKEEFSSKVFDVLSSAFTIAGDALYAAIKEEHPNWAALLFPDRHLVEANSAQFKEILQEEGVDAALEWVNTLKKHGVLSESAAKSLIESATNGIVSGVDENAPTVTKSVDDLTSSVSSSFSGMAANSNEAMRSMRSYMTPEMENIRRSLSENAKQAQQDVDGAFQGINTSTTGNTQTTSSFLTTAWESIKLNISSAGNAIKSSVTSVWDTVKTKISSVGDSIKSLVSSAWNNIVSNTNSASSNVQSSVGNMSSATSSDLGSMASTFSSKSSQMKSSITNALSGAKSTVQNLGWYNVGSNITSGILNGLYNWGNKLKSWAKSLLSSAKDALGIASPSKLFRDEVGRYLGMGVAAGFEDSESYILASVKNVTASMSEKMRAIPHDFSGELSYAVNRSYSDSYEADYSNVQGQFSDDMHASGEEIINAILALGQRIIYAINEKETDVYFDTQKVGSSTTGIQNRQNIMYGKTLQNV